MSVVRILVLSVLLGLTGLASAAVFEPREFDSAEQEGQYKQLINELRCLVCQNQNIADSEAELAGDLRREVYGMLRAGKNEDEIIDFMVHRYGDFVLYRPPLKTSTVLLWAGPFVLGLGALVMLFSIMRQRAGAQPPSELSDEERERLAKLVAGNSADGTNS